VVVEMLSVNPLVVGLLTTMDERYAFVPTVIKDDAVPGVPPTSPYIVMLLDDAAIVAASAVPSVAMRNASNDVADLKEFFTYRP
jgi:hypothetical protein